MKRCVLTTRSPMDAPAMLARLRRAGLTARNLPLLRFQPQTLAPMGAAPDWLIALSPAAIRHGWPQLPPDWQQYAQLAAVGPGTQALLRQLSGRSILTPAADAGGAEALLEQLPQHLHGQQIVLLGTEVLSPGLQQVLRQRGAQVTGLTAAIAEPLPPSPKRVAALLKRYDQVVTTIMSQRALNALHQLPGPGLTALQRQPLFVISQRLADSATEAGWQQIHFARQATLDGLCQSLIDWHRQHSENTA